MAMELANPPRTILLPFFGLAHNTLEPWSRSGEQKRFPHAIADWFASDGITARERRMLDFMNQITDKPSWNTKVFDNSIVGRWKKEAVRWDEELPEKGDWWLSGKMFEACLLELREKARRFKDMGFVAVLDAEATIVKSDTVVTHELRDELRQAVHPLEDVPEQMKDYHPGSGEQVLDLVHPSLFPVVFGVSKALPHGTVPLDSCLSYTGKGETIARFDATRHVRKGSWGNEEHIENAWGSFQWLPSNVTFREDGTAKIDSYINNVHPHQHKALYKVLEKFVDVSIPLWNECLSRFDSRIRIKLVDTSKADYVVREGARFPREQYITEDETVDSADEEEEDDEDDDDDAWAENHNRVDELQDWRDDNCVLEQPEPEYRSQTEYCKDHSPHLVDLKKDFADRGIQVIFKLANIHLTPEDPKYPGGSWHIEGSLNEHICATALYYYDCENVTDSRLAFRQSYDVQGITSIPEQVCFAPSPFYANKRADAPYSTSTRPWNPT
jgi:hypothetical protein